MSDFLLKPTTSHNLPPNVTLGQFFFDSAQKHGNRICQIDALTDHYDTFSSIKRRSTRVAIEMGKRGVTSEDVIILCSSTTLDTPVPLLAACYLGAKVGTLDPSLSRLQTTHLLGLVSPKMIFVEESSVSLIEESTTNLNTLIVIFGNSDKHLKYSDFEKPQETEDEFRPVPVDTNQTAILLFSSGTSGLPKAICHSSYSFLHCVFNFYNSNVKLDTILSFSSFYWITTNIFFTCTFIKGDRRVICGNKVVPETTFKAIEKYKITYMFLTPILTYQLTNFGKHQDYDTSSLYVLLTAGTALSSNQFKKLSIVFANSHICGCYGQTETGVISLFNPSTDQELIPRKIKSCGKIIAGVTLKIIDTETNITLGANQKGEICVKTDAAMKGYYQADSSLIFTDDGFLKTGDVGYYDEDQCLFIVDRLKEMFKYLSWHIVPSAIEEVLLQHPLIEECVVFGLPKNEEEGEVPAACIVLKKGYDVKEQEIEDFVAERVSDREKLRGGVFILDELPRTPSGKVMRREVRNSIINLSQ